MVEKRLALKTIEMHDVVAKLHGMGDLKDISPAEYESVRDLTEKFYEAWKEAKDEGILVGVADVPFNKLAAERFEIEQALGKA
jgi:hypothetical protein